MQQILRKSVMVVMALALAFGVWGGMPVQKVAAAGTIGYYPLYLPADAVFSGTAMTGGAPFAVYATITGAPSSTACTGPKLRLLPTETGGTADANFRSWASVTASWLTDSGAWASFGTITTDASGNWSGWGFGAAPSTVTNTWLEFRIRCGSNNYSTSRVQITLMDMSASGIGGYLEETSGTSRAGHAVVVKDGTNIVGMYVAEDNSIVEGYSSNASYTRVSAPACVGCGYTVEAWDLSNPGTPIGKINTLGAQSCPSDIAAGATSSLDSCITPTQVDLAGFSAAWQGDAVAVTWETAQELDNLGFNLYRGESEAGPWVKLNAELIPTQVPGAVSGAVYEWLDAGVTPGTAYFYRLEDVDIYGLSTFHGPVGTEPAGPSAVTLAAFGANGAAWGLPLALAALGLWGVARKRRS